MEPGETTVKPAFGVGTLVVHPNHGRGRVVGYEDRRYVVVFIGGETRRIPFHMQELKAETLLGDPQTDILKQAVREVLADQGWVAAEVEMAPRWQGGMLRLIPGREGTQPKEIPLEVFFSKLIGIREKLRVLEQKINNHPKLDAADKLELEGYITRSYGSLTSFNLLFADKDSQFKGAGRAGAEGTA